MSNKSPPTSKPVLPYATPRPAGGGDLVAAMIVALAGAGLIVLGGAVGFSSVVGANYLFAHRDGNHFYDDAFELVVLFLLGLMFLFVGFRCLRSVPAIFRGTFGRSDNSD